MSVLTDGDIDLIAAENGYSPMPVRMYKTDLRRFARAIEEACQPHWRSVSKPPPMHRVEYGCPESEPMLVWPSKVTARYVQPDKDFPQQWLMQGPDGWDITSCTTHWMPLPEGPAP